MADASQEMDSTNAEWSWRPTSLRQTNTSFLPLRWRLTMLAVVVLAHVGGFLWLKSVRGEANFRPVQAMVINFIERVRSPIKPEPIKLFDNRAVAPINPTPTLQRPLPDSALEVPEKPVAAPTAALQLYEPDGRVHFSAQMLQELDKNFGDHRVFSYQIPHLNEAGKFFDRPQVLAYEGTRFDQYWQPNKDLLTDMLSKAVEKSTVEIRVPLPGRGHSKVVCRVALLALGGGCGVVTEGENYNGPQDDPNTLSPSEQRECEAWWNKIAAATSQDIWRRTRALYDEQCRKPNAKPN